MVGLTDLEMTKLCAEAMELNFTLGSDGYVWVVDEDVPGGMSLYYPLRMDAQAFALVKRFEIVIQWPMIFGGVKLAGAKFTVGASTYLASAESDLNRAIVECVAKMQMNNR